MTHVFNRGDGQDLITDDARYASGTAGDDTILFGAGITQSDLSMSAVGMDLVVKINNPLNPSATDQITIYGWYTDDRYRIETFKFADGSSLSKDQITSISAPIQGTEGADRLTAPAIGGYLMGLGGNDTLIGGAGADTLIGGLGNDTYVVDNASDVVTENLNEGTDTVQSIISYTLGTNLENLTLTGSGNDLNNSITGNSAANLLSGGGGNDTLTDTSGGNLLDGGDGNDTLTAGTANDLLAGGSGNDTLNTGNGADILLFNSGHGQDLLNASGTDNTLSLGGGINYANLKLGKTGNHLILKTGGSDQITLKNWYAAASNHSVINLQIIAEAMAGFTQGGSDPLRNNKIETFDFAGLVADFDAAGAPSNWTLTDARLTAHLTGGSDDSAIGGDLAYQYGKTGSFAGIGVNAAQSVINQIQTSPAAQTLHDPGVWQAELIKLG